MTAAATGREALHCGQRLQAVAGRDHYSCGEDGWEAVADPAMGLAGRPAPGRP